LKILVGKCFGIGNAVLSIPMIKALSTIGEVDVLIGNLQDDQGSREVFASLKKTTGCIENIFVGSAPLDVDYDYAIMAIPFDGRWVNGVHFRAKRVLDERRRPGNATELGFHMWNRHEVEYQMDNAIYLGYDGLTPNTRFCVPSAWDENLVYIGLGYKRDPGGFGLSKHFGNDNFILFIQCLRQINPALRFISTGTGIDMLETGGPIMRAFGPDVFQFRVEPLDMSLATIATCGSYFGNDTGMMHVAASLDLWTLGVTPHAGLLIKNPPFCKHGRMRLLPTSVTELAEEFNHFLMTEA